MDENFAGKDWCDLCETLNECASFGWQKLKVCVVCLASSLVALPGAEDELMEHSFYRGQEDEDGPDARPFTIKVSTGQKELVLV
jgi:hypothetical protein